jgi:lipopolysaccharide export system permease protein
MLILDQYVLRLFAKVLLVAFVSLTGLYTVIDAFGNLEEFITYGHAHGGMWGVIFGYYGARALTFFDRTSPLLALVAAMFAIAWLQRTNELTALMAAGIPKARLVKPLIGAVIVVSLIAALNRELLIPAVRERLTRNAQDLSGDRSKTVHPCYDNETNIFISGSACYAADRRIASPHFKLHSPLGKFGGELVAKDATYEPPSEGRPGGYRLTEVTEPANLTEISSATLRERLVILSPKDTAWLSPNECFVATAVTFDQVCGGTVWHQYSSTAELIAGLRNPSLDYGADARVTTHSRFVQPLLDVTLLFLGLPLVVTRENRNLFAAVGWALALVALFYVVVLGCHILGTSGLLSPPLAAWCPLFVFGPAAVAVARFRGE